MSGDNPLSDKCCPTFPSCSGPCLVRQLAASNEREILPALRDIQKSLVPRVAAVEEGLSDLKNQVRDNQLEAKREKVTYGIR